MCVLVLEALLRVVGYDPSIEHRTEGFADVYEADPVTGWRLRPGVHLGKPGLDSGKRAMLTVLPGGCRVTRPDYSIRQGEAGEPSAREQLILLGCSFTEGEGLDDRDTLAWLAQEKLSQFEIVNFGTGGFSGCQSLLRMRQFLQESPRAKPVFVYGFVAWHEERNIAHPQYVWRLARAAKSRSVHMPYCSVDRQGGLVFHPPEQYDALLPFSEESAVVCLVEELYYAAKAKFRAWDQRLVSERVILQMNELAKERGARFIVFLFRLEGNVRRHYLSFLQSRDIEYIDGFHVKQDDPAMTLADGHPNAAMARIWAEQLVLYLQRDTASGS